AGLDAVAHVGIAARLPVGNRGVHAATGGVARIARAGVAVIAIERVARTRSVHAALVDRAEVRVRAVGVHGAAAGNRLIVAAGRRVARKVGGAGVAVVAVERRARCALAVHAGLDAVADVAVRARRAVEQRRVHAAARGIARVDGAHL